MNDADDNAPTPIVTRSTPLSLAQALTVTREKFVWERRATSWDKAGSAGLTKVVEAVVTACREQPGGVAVDLGCGSGQVTIALARSCSRVLAVDVSVTAINMLEAKARNEGIENIQVLAGPIETLSLEPDSVDLVVSNYAMHHLRHADKEELVRRAFWWLRPGGRLVIGDMMFGRGSDSADRAIIAGKLRALAKRGPGGWWRIVKNIGRFTLRVTEKPLTTARWESIIRSHGFQSVSTRRIVAEACIVVAVKPLSGSQSAQSSDQEVYLPV